MFWQETKKEEPYEVPDDVIDLVFKVKGKSIDVDHAWNLAVALQSTLGEKTCSQLGIFPILTGQSGNGWFKPEDQVFLSRRAQLAIRLHRDLLDETKQLIGQSIDVGEHQIELGDTHERALSTHDTVFSRGISCDPGQDEADFMNDIAERLQKMGVPVRKMLCGKDSQVKSADDSITVRSVMIADLKPEHSVLLQRRGLGRQQHLGLGLFIPHKGIDAVFEVQD